MGLAQIVTLTPMDKKAGTKMFSKCMEKLGKFAGNVKKGKFRELLLVEEGHLFAQIARSNLKLITQNPSLTY